MKWVTRARPKVDRVACPWLIKRFVDSQAEFLYVPADQVMELAKREGAIPFDVSSVELGHHGPECTFDAIRCEGSHARITRLGGDRRRVPTDIPERPRAFGTRVGCLRCAVCLLSKYRAKLPDEITYCVRFHTRLPKICRPPASACSASERR